MFFSCSSSGFIPAFSRRGSGWIRFPSVHLPKISSPSNPTEIDREPRKYAHVSGEKKGCVSIYIYIYNLYILYICVYVYIYIHTYIHIYIQLLGLPLWCLLVYKNPMNTVVSVINHSEVGVMVTNMAIFLGPHFVMSTRILLHHPAVFIYNWFYLEATILVTDYHRWSLFLGGAG